MSRYIAACMAGYLAGLKHKELKKQLCWAKMKKRFHSMARMFW